MAANPGLRRAIRRIAEAVHDFAKERGWDANTYRLFYRADEAWNHIHLVLVAQEFQGGDYHANYRAVSDSLQKNLQDEPGLFDSLGIVLMDESRYQRGGFYSLGPEYADVAEEFRDFWSLTQSTN